MVEITGYDYIWLQLCNVAVLIYCTDKLLENSTWYNNWKHKRRFKKSEYTLSEKDVVVKGE